MMDMEVIKFGFQVIQFLLTGGVMVYVYLVNKDKVTNDRIERLEDDLDEKLDGQGERIAKLETRADGQPTHEDLSKLHEKINTVSKDISNLSGQFIGVNTLLQTIHRHLMKQGGSND